MRIFFLFIYLKISNLIAINYLSCSHDLADYLSFEDNDNFFKFCGDRQSSIAIETCSNKLNVSLFTNSQPDDSYRGALIYYECVENIQKHTFFFA